MTTLIAETTGQLAMVMSHRRMDELAFRTAAEIVGGGEDLIVVDPAGCFDPNRMTHSARIGTIDPAGFMKHLHILRAGSAQHVETIILHELEDACEKYATHHVLIPDLLSALYNPAISTRDAARILGRVKTKLEELAEAGQQIVLLCRHAGTDVGTKAHFLASLRGSAQRVYYRSNT